MSGSKVTADVTQAASELIQDDLDGSMVRFGGLVGDDEDEEVKDVSNSGVGKKNLVPFH